MSITETTRRAGPYATDGSQVEFPFAFKVFKAEDVVVTRSESGIDTELSLTTDYTVNLNPNQDAAPGGEVVLTSAPNGPTITITSGMAATQPTVFTNAGGFFPRVLNDSLDRVTILVQQLMERVSRVPLLPLGDAPVGQFPVVLPNGKFGWSTGSGTDSGLRADLGTDAPGKGVDLIVVGGKFADVDAKVRSLREKFGDLAVSITDYEGAHPDASADSSYAFEAAKNALKRLPGGSGNLLIPGRFLIGEQEVDTHNTIISGHSPADALIVKSGTLGIHVNSDWVHFRDISILSEGSKNDGLGTSGVLYSEGAGSTGHIFNERIRIEGFSGVGMEVRNTLDLQIIGMFVRDCMTGFRWARHGTGPADFSTTSNLQMCYGIACDVAYDLLRVRHTLLTHVICEWNRIGILSDISDFGMKYCYFENNSERGVRSINSAINEEGCYYNSSADEIERTYPGGVIAAADRYFQRNYKGDTVSKRFGLLSGYASEERFLAAVGNSNAIGLKFGEAVVPTVYGDDLLDPGAWESMTGGGFQGWDVAHRGYKIEGTTSGGNVRGMQQSVSLDSTKNYVIAFNATNVAGAALTTVQVDGVTRTPGVPFTVSTTGTKVVRTYAAQTGAYENYVHVFRLMEVLEDQTQIAKTTDILLRTPDQRGKIYMSAPPVSGTWARGEIVWNSAPTPGGYTGWVCTTDGTPGTWKGFGAIEV